MNERFMIGVLECVIFRGNQDGNKLFLLSGPSDKDAYN